MPGDIWSLALIGGPILLLAVIIWAFLRNRSAPPQHDPAGRARRG